MVKKNGTLSNQVAQDILKLVVSEEFAPGTLLPSERELQERYSVSRTVIREATQQLTARGILMQDANAGTVISSDFTAPAMEALILAFQQSQVCTEDIINARLILEPAIASLAAQNAAALQIRQLKSLVQLFNDAVANGGITAQMPSEHALESWMSADVRFHRVLAESSQNPIFVILIQIIVGTLWRQRRGNDRYLGQAHWTAAAKQHNAIADAVAAHDALLARKAMIEHLEHTRRSLETLQGGLSDPVKMTLE